MSRKTTDILRSTDLGAAIGRGEHISLATESFEERAKPRPDRAIASFELRNRARGVITEIDILEDHYVAVNVRRRTASVTHNVDLRFVDPHPKAFRQVAWRMLWAALSLTTMTGATLFLNAYLPLLLPQSSALSAAVILGALAVVAYLAFYYRTTESMYFLSVHGRVPVIAMTGNLGAFRKGKPCIAEVVKRIHLARTQFRQPKAAYLRDEMREHARLQEQGALTEKTYSEAKARILQAHA